MIQEGRWSNESLIADKLLIVKTTIGLPKDGVTLRRDLAHLMIERHRGLLKIAAAGLFGLDRFE